MGDFLRYLFFINYECGTQGENSKELKKNDHESLDVEISLNLNENTEISLNFGKMY